MISIDNKYLPVFFIALPIGFIIIVVVGTYFQNKEWEEHLEITFLTEFEGEITALKTDGAILLEVNNKNKFRLDYTHNSSYEPNYLGDFAHIGDYVVKHVNSDSIFIYQDSIKYYFIIGKRLERINTRHKSNNIN